MNHYLLVLFAFSISFISCHEESKIDQKPFTEKASDSTTTSVNEIFNKEKPFELILSLEKKSSNKYVLKVDLDVCEGCHYVSNKSKDKMRGAFKIELEGVNKIVSSSEYIENPESTHSLDPFSNSEVYFITEHTTISQKLSVINSDDFKVSGAVSFVIEPACNNYKTDFEITQVDKQLQINKGETYIENFE